MEDMERIGITPNNMPELPEVETIKNILNNIIIGRGDKVKKYFLKILFRAIINCVYLYFFTNRVHYLYDIIPPETGRIFIL